MIFSFLAHQQILVKGRVKLVLSSLVLIHLASSQVLVAAWVPKQTVPHKADALDCQLLHASLHLLVWRIPELQETPAQLTYVNLHNING